MKITVFEEANERDNDSRSLNLTLAAIGLDHPVSPLSLARQHAREFSFRNAGCHPRAQTGKSNLH